ncbi:MAG: aldolase catalytic domain-containing protein [Flavobacteriales bacterium]
MGNTKILDCTLRDGGYYTNWDFDHELVKNYFTAMEVLPIDYLEIGYRSKPLKGYLGEYFYCPKYIFKQAKELAPSKKIAVILNEKDCDVTDVEYLLGDLENYIDLVRLAVSPSRFDSAILLAKAIKNKGFRVAFNIMYMSKWVNDTNFFDNLHQVNGLADYFYMVDSYGSLYPDQIKEFIKVLKNKINIPLGFHGHNNLEFAHINTLTAIDSGCEIVDATITGMGRGAGNLKTELLLTSLANNKGLEVSFNSLSAIVEDFEALQKQYGWGTNLPYMVSGTLSQPQKDVMEWITKRAYSINSIITALHNKSDNQEDNIQLRIFQSEQNTFNKVLVIGGGTSPKKHLKAIKHYVNSEPNVCLIHASSKNARAFKSLNCDQYFCLVGNEGYRLQKVLDNDLTDLKCILPPYPRKMGTFIPNPVKESSYELKEISFTDRYKDSHFAIALQLALELKTKEVYLVGFDGYIDNVSQKEIELSNENEYLIKKFSKLNIPLVSLTETQYSIDTKSIYSFLK